MQTSGEKPPVEQPLIREGDFAFNLADALKLGPLENEIEAESKLGDAGIAPRNGWIADYPVTPDIIGEIRKSISDAANAGLLAMNTTDALKSLQNLISGLNLAIGDGSSQTKPARKGQKNDTETSGTVVTNYYHEHGPPVVTYYSPPPNYTYLYTWVPYPFWWWNSWFPGYFILVDFHRIIHKHEHVNVISNLCIDRRTNRVFRIDPIARFHGRTYGGIGVPRSSKRYMIRVPLGDRDIFYKSSREREMVGQSYKTFAPPTAIGNESGVPHTGGVRPEKR